jgi:hypothetical protein
MKLIDLRTADGSRHFARFRQAAPWAAVREHALLLPNAVLINCVGNEMAHAWLDFHFRRHRFLISAQEGYFHLFVRDPQCSDLLLFQVGCHFEQLLAEA